MLLRIWIALSAGYLLGVISASKIHAGDRGAVAFCAGLMIIAIATTIAFGFGFGLIWLLQVRL